MNHTFNDSEHVYPVIKRMLPILKVSSMKHTMLLYPLCIQVMSHIICVIYTLRVALCNIIHGH